MLRSPSNIERFSYGHLLFLAQPAPDVVRLSCPLVPFPSDDASHAVNSLERDVSKTARFRSEVRIRSYGDVPNWPAKVHLNSLVSAVYAQDY